MEEKILEEIKRAYEKRKEEREHLSCVLEEVTKLEKDENVKRYLKLKEELESVEYEKRLRESDEQILDSTFYNYRYMIKETNNVYLCMGTFMMDNNCDIEHGPSDIRLRRDDKRAEYRIYRNIEDGYSERISIRYCEEFEKKHKVIIPKTMQTERYFNELQKEFIRTAIKEGQEEACKKLLCKKISNLN